MLCAELERRGWTREVTAELWMGSLAPVADHDLPGGVVLSRVVDEAWLSRYQRKGMSEVALTVLRSGPSVWFATVPGPAGAPPAAIGRCVVDGRWAGFAAVEVDPSRRRQGLATGRLRSVLPEWTVPPAAALYAIYPAPLEGDPRVHRFVDFLAANIVPALAHPSADGS